MARLVNRLRPADVTAAEGPALLNDGFGLYLQVDGNANKSWVFRFKLPGGRTRDMGLGSASTITLKQARDRAGAARMLKEAGTDPIDERAARLKAAAEARQADAAKPTFEVKSREWHAANKERWESKKNQVRWLSSMEQYAFAKIGKLLVSEVDTDAVLRVIRPMWHAKNHTANRVRGQIESVLSAAKVEGLRTGDNPARWSGHLSEILPRPRKVAPAVNHPALPYPELPEFMHEVRQREGIPARALEFLILNASRTGEVVGAVWPEFDLDRALWRIPGPRMKMRKPHTVPLCPRSVEILRGLPHEQGNDYAFIGSWAGHHLGKMAMPDLLASMRDNIVVHGFRAVFSTWVAEETDFPTDIREAALAHKVGDNSAVAYQRGTLLKKRRELMMAWTNYCMTPPKTADVLPLPAPSKKFLAAV